MKRFNLIAPILLWASLSINAAEDFLVDGILIRTPQPNIQSCITYMPSMGEVKKAQDLKVTSDKFQFTDDRKLILQGNVELDFPEGLLRSQNAELDRENGKIKFSKDGDIFLKDFYFNADNGYLNNDNKSIALSEGILFSKERSLIFNFSDLNGQLDKQINLKDASMSSCSNPDQGWILEAKEIILDSETNRGLAKNIKIKASGKTIFALPLIPFAISEERMSGFLEPSISYSSDGIDLMAPYYKVISNSSDLTLASRYIAKRGPGLELNYRSLHGKNKNYRNIDLIYFFKDDEFNKENMTKDSSRWIFSYQDKFQNNSSLIKIDWSKSSDTLMLRDIPGEITSIGNQRKQNLSQSIFLTRKFNNLLIKIEHQSYQSLNPILTNGYKKSPSLELYFSKNIAGITLTETINISSFKANLIHGYNGYQNINERYVRLIEDPKQGTRLYSNFSLAKRYHFNGISINSVMGLKSIIYDLTGLDSDTNNVYVPNAKIDISSIFINEKSHKREIIQPRLVLGYTSYKDQSNNPIFDTDMLSANNELFSNERFSGMDRIGDQQFYTLSVKYKKIAMGMEKISLSLSKKYYLKDRNIFLNEMIDMPMNQMMDMSTSGMMDMPMSRGPLVIMGKWMPSMNTMIMGYGGYFNNRKIPLAGISINQKFTNGSFGYAKRYRRSSGSFDNIMDYSELYAQFNLNMNLKLIAKLKRDDRNSKNIESIVGLEYENCCLALRLTTSDKNLSRFEMNKEEIYYHHLADAWDNMIEIENKSRINFEFELKGLNSSLRKVNKLLNTSLLNY